MLLSVNVFSVNVMFCSLDEMQRIFQERKKKGSLFQNYTVQT